MSADEPPNLPAGPEVPARPYHYWTDRELWDLFCWWEAKRRVNNIVGKAVDYGTTASNLGLQIRRARRDIAEIERRLGKTHLDREANIKAVLDE